MSDEGAHELARVLISTGYGNDKEIASEICANRPEIAARIFDQIQNNDILKHKVEDIISNNLDDEDSEEYHDLSEVI